VLLAHFGTPSSVFARIGATDVPRLAEATSVRVQPGDEWQVTAPVRVSLDSPVAARLLPGSSAPGPVYVGAPQARPPAGAEPPISVLTGDVDLPAGLVRWQQPGQVTMAAGEAVPFGAGTPSSASRSWERPFG